MTSINVLAHKFASFDETGFIATFSAADLVEWFEAPNGQSWQTSIQVEAQASAKRRIEMRDGLAHYLGENGIPVLEPFVATYDVDSTTFEEKINHNGDSVGVLTINQPMIALSAIQQLYAVQQVLSNLMDLPASAVLAELKVSVTLVAGDDFDVTNAYEYVNREFSDAQMSAFSMNELTMITDDILSSTLLRADNELDGQTSEPKLLVNTKSSSVAERSLVFTTKKNIETINELLPYKGKKLSTEAKAMWTAFANTEPVLAWKHNPREINDFRESGDFSILLRLGGQTAVFHTAIELRKDGLSWTEAFETLLATGLRLDDPQFKDWFVNTSGRAISARGDILQAAKHLYETVKG